jgi:16S rRNA (cytidine1402-2'-O)-methyltransferase
MAIGTLILGSNSLGLPADIPSRSLEACRQSDLVIFEEDRMARQTLKAAGIHRDYLKFNEHRQKDTVDEVRQALKDGKTVLYMSDQGSPIIEDPGAELVAVARQVQAKVTVIPGPCSITAALTACSFAGHSYFFAGFMPREPQDRLKRLKELQAMKTVIVMMDTPYRLKQLLEACEQVFSAGRKALLALDISGDQENFIELSLSSLRKQADQLGDKLNFVLVIAP